MEEPPWWGWSPGGRYENVEKEVQGVGVLGIVGGTSKKQRQDRIG